MARLAAERLPRRREPVRYYDNLKRTPLAKQAARSAAFGERPVARGERLPRGAPGLPRLRRIRRHALRWARAAPARRRALLRPGLLRLDGLLVPAALGAQIGTGTRPLVLCGDGAFQMTGPEIAHAPRHGLSPIVVLVNNAGLADLPAGDAAPRPARDPALAVRGARPGLGRRRLPRRDAERAARGAARGARGARLRDHRVLSPAATTSRRSRDATSARALARAAPRSSLCRRAAGAGAR